MIYAINKRTKEHLKWPRNTDIPLPEPHDWEIFEADADGWIPWDAKPGAECPLSESAKCDAWVWKGSAGEAMIVSGYRAADLLREHGARNIIAYRPILDAEPPARKSVEQITDGGCRAMGEMSRQAQGETEAPEWDGEGLPPVGCECEYIGNDTSWGTVRVIGYDGDAVVFRPSGEQYYSAVPGHRDELRPLRTPAQRAEEAMTNVMYECDLAGNISAKEAANALYACIRDGKIPGVKLEDE